MKLRIVPARTGTRWVRDGVRTFFRQPLALGSLFGIFILLMSLAAMVPWVGGVLALVLMPAATLGLMAATREADEGRAPMPVILFTAFRQGPRQTRAMLVLGALYAVGVMIVMGISSLIDGGQFAQVYLGGDGVTRELVMDPRFRTAMWVTTLLYLPLSLAFWHAPALVHWHAVPPVKSLFFSLVAVLRNTRAFLLFGAMWMAMSFGAGLVLLVLTAVTGSAAIAAAGLLPTGLVIGAMFFVSLWFTFRDSFMPEADPAEPST